MNAPLVVTADPALVEEIQRLAAAAGVQPEVCSSVEQALARWAKAPLVLVGSDLAESLAQARPPRRDAAHLVVLGSGQHLFGVALAVGVETVAELPRSEAWLVETLTDAGDRAPRHGLTLGVIGGSGGAGATTFACALGQMAAPDHSALVVDLDPLGPGLDRVLGVEHVDGVRWDALQQTTGRLSARSLHDAVPRHGAVGVLTWAPGAVASVQGFAVREVLSAGRRGHDLVILDLPRSLDAATLEAVARCDQVVVMARPSVTGVAAAARLAARLRHTSPARLLVRGEGVSLREIERVTGLRGALAMADQRGLAEAIDLGHGPVRKRRGPLARAAEEVLDRLLATHRAA